MRVAMFNFDSVERVRDVLSKEPRPEPSWLVPEASIRAELRVLLPRTVEAILGMLWEGARGALQLPTV